MMRKWIFPFFPLFQMININVFFSGHIRPYSFFMRFFIMFIGPSFRVIFIVFYFLFWVVKSIDNLLFLLFHIRNTIELWRLIVIWIHSNIETITWNILLPEFFAIKIIIESIYPLYQRHTDLSFSFLLL